MSPRNSASWYRQLGSLTRAGITIPSAVRQASGPSALSREILAARLEAGEDPRSAWAEAGPWLAESDALTLASGQLSGRFPEVCEELGLRHEARAKVRSKLVIASLYPLFLLNVAAIIAPFIHDIDLSGNAPTLHRMLVGGAVGAAMNLLAIWGTVFAGIWILKNNPRLRAGVFRVLPFWSGAAHHGALASFAGTLASLLRAGVGIGDAWVFAGKASGDPRIADAAVRVGEHVETRSRPPGELLPELAVFPHEFRALYIAGEKSGSLEEKLDMLAREHTARSSERATLAVFLYPAGFTVLAMLVVAARIVGFWANYFKTVNDLAQ